MDIGLLMDRRRYSYGYDWDLNGDNHNSRIGLPPSAHRFKVTPNLSTHTNWANSKESSSDYTDGSSDCGKGEESLAVSNRRRCRRPISISDAAKFKRIMSLSNGDQQSFGRNSFERRDLGSAGSRTSVSSRESNGSFSRRERRDALKARVEALRERFCDSSSNEDDGDEDDSVSYRRPDSDCRYPNSLAMQRYFSDESLNKKTRSSRTDRYWKRMSRGDDNRNSERNIDVESDNPVDAPSMWNATVVYQRSSIYGGNHSTAKCVGAKNDDSSYSSYHSAFENPHESNALTRHTRRIQSRQEDGQRTSWKYLAPPHPSAKRRNSSGMASKDYDVGLPRAPTPPPRGNISGPLVVHPTPVVIAEAKQKVITYPVPLPTGHSAKPKKDDKLPLAVPHRNGAKDGVKKFVDSYEKSSDKGRRFSYDQNIGSNEPSSHNSVLPDRLISRRASDVSVNRSVNNFWKQKDAEAQNALKWDQTPPADCSFDKNEQTSWCYNSVYDSQDFGLKKSNSETGIGHSNPLCSDDVPEAPLRRAKYHQSAKSTPSLDNAENLIEGLVRRNKEKRRSQMNDAIVELENMYEKLNLADDELMDRAERRDLPVRIQELGRVPKDQQNSVDDVPEECLDSSECLIKGRTPRLRRSGIPDKINDDFAFRKIKSSPKPEVPKSTPISYLLCSPVLTTPVDINGSSSSSPFANCEPDIITDDVTYRNYQRANMESSQLLNQKPFGIPIGPVTQASPSSNYVKMSSKVDDTRPTFHAKANPDVVRDDMAFRNLRKDTKPKVDFAELDRIIRGETLSKKRIRSLKTTSVHVDPLQTAPVTSQEFERAQSLTDLAVPPKVGNVKEPRNRFYESEGTSTETLTSSKPDLYSVAPQKTGKFDVRRRPIVEPLSTSTYNPPNASLLSEKIKSLLPEENNEDLDEAVQKPTIGNVKDFPSVQMYQNNDAKFMEECVPQAQSNSPDDTLSQADDIDAQFDRIAHSSDSNDDEELDKLKETSFSKSKRIEPIVRTGKFPDNDHLQNRELRKEPPKPCFKRSWSADSGRSNIQFEQQMSPHVDMRKSGNEIELKCKIKMAPPVHTSTATLSVTGLVMSANKQFKNFEEVPFAEDTCQELVAGCKAKIRPISRHISMIKEPKIIAPVVKSTLSRIDEPLDGWKPATKDPNLVLTEEVTPPRKILESLNDIYENTALIDKHPSSIIGRRRSIDSIKSAPKSFETSRIMVQKTKTKFKSLIDVRTLEGTMDAPKEEEEQDKLSQMSLADKIKLFKQKSEKENSPQVVRRRRQADQSRFKTQPVTFEEVENATNEIHSTKSCTPASGVVKSMSMLLAKEFQSKIIKSDSQDSSTRKSILKTEEASSHQKEVIKGILKSDSNSHAHSLNEAKPPVKSILKPNEPKSDEKKKNKPTKSILKSHESSNPVTKSSSSDSSGEEMESSGRIDGTHDNGHNDKKKKTNPAVMRRLQANQRRSEGRRNSTNTSYAMMMMKVNEESPYIVESSPGLKQRLAALQKSQDEGWKERLHTLKSDDPEKEIGLKTVESSSKKADVKLRPKGPPSRVRPVSIADRMNLLESSKAEWQKRVEKNDAEQYTVAGKMGKPSGDVTPTSQRKLKVPELQIFRSKTDDINKLKSMGAISLFPITPLKKNSPQITKSKSSSDALCKILDSSDSENDENDDPTSVFKTPEVFNVASTNLDDGVKIDEDSFASFILQTAKSSDKLHVEHRTVRAHRKKTTCGNPVKKLASRTDLSFAYKQETVSNSSNAIKDSKIAALSKSSSLANSALAGLASVEDFASVSLRKVDSTDGCFNNALSTFKNKMLLQIKGRRIIQTRLVNPVSSFINDGDCFLLITPNIAYQYIGKYSNIIEKSKSSDIASIIKSRKELGYKNGAKDVVLIDQDSNVSKEHEKEFWALLDSDSIVNPKEAGPPDEDENFETLIVSTNKVYKVESTSLVPCKEHWGQSLSYDMLKPDQVFVFDFGSEMYIWHGKLAPIDLRRISVQLAKELWDQGYDYSKCNINPLCPMLEEGKIQGPIIDASRPEWTLLARVNQHMESILFKEKFHNWPNEDRDSSKKRSPSSDSDSSDVGVSKSSDMVACNVEEMINNPKPEVDLVLEMSHLGRGIEYHDEVERRHFEIETQSLQVWHVQEFGTEKLEKESWGQFHSSDTYVVRWFYTVIQTGRALTGGASKHNRVGRDRCAYFFWQGRDSSISEKGVCALMTVELDEERGPHIRVTQGKEPPCFLNIFKGSIAIHKGRRKDQRKNEEWRLFVLLGEEPTEAMIVEVECKISSLRSRGVFMLVNTSTCDVYVWYGSQISRPLRTIARTVIDHLKKKKPEMQFCNKSSVTIHREHEGNESSNFFKGLGSSNSELYHSLLKDESTFDYTMRVFHFTSISGTFGFTEILCPYRKNDSSCAFPVVQDNLYKVSQPALFLIDNRKELFIWQGWHSKTNSCPLNRWKKEKHCALDTSMSYANHRNIDEKKIFLITAGCEPLNFKNLFPEWIDVEIEDLEETECMKPQLVCDLLKEMKKTTYSLEELKDQPLPPGVDPNNIEAYLNDEEFQQLFEMNKEEFYEKPSWKQLELRKAARLF